ncbi:MAG: class I SAM-dependent methyltransferase, partial [Gemmataceae bacterium]
MSESADIPASFFDTVYEGAPMWEIGRPQEDIIRLCARGGFNGEVLDLSCGTGHNAIYLASKGLRVHGVDRAPAAIERARANAAQVGSTATFEVQDVLAWENPSKKYDTLLDSTLFHFLSDRQRELYVQALAKLVKLRGILHILCFSDQEPGTEGPRRIGERELIDLLNMRGWLVEEIAEARYETTQHPDGARAWLATFVR